MKIKNLPQVIEISKALGFARNQLEKLEKLSEPTKTSWTLQSSDRTISVTVPPKLKELISSEINELYNADIENYNEILIIL
jgi:hypothetical protein